MKFLDLFAGVGGFRLGMENKGHECVGFCEIDKYARRSYKAIHDTTGEVEWHDITAVSDEHIRSLRGQVNVICGGFPCQSFSVAGNRGGFDDARGTLFFEIARIANIVRPQYLFLENVRGLLSHDSGNTFETILRALDDIGYDAEWEVLNTKDFSTTKRPTPQNRERVFLIGHLRNGSGRKVFPVTRGGESADINIVGTTKSETRTIGQRDVVFGEDGSIGTLQSSDFKQPKQIMQAGELDINANDQNKRVYDVKGLAPTLSTMQGGGQEPKIREGYRIRKITPKEAWRLQSFPDWAYERASEVNSDSQLYKQAGNSVSVNVIEAIAEGLYV